VCSPALIFLQVLTSIETSPEILAQVQEVIIPIIFFTLDHSLLGESSILDEENQIFIEDGRVVG